MLAEKETPVIPGVETNKPRYVVNFRECGIGDVDRVGGKNASLGEMTRHLSPLGVEVPEGFATTADAFDEFLAQDRLGERIQKRLQRLDVGDITELANVAGWIRNRIMELELPADLTYAITAAYRAMAERIGEEFSVAVRSSATAEDLLDASFAGQQETFLNVVGLDAVLIAVKKVFASLFNDRAISYRVHKGFDHTKISISVGIQLMVRSDLAVAGTMFTLDMDSGFRDVVVINSSYGLGESVVQGAVNPDEICVYKRSLEQSRPAILRKNLSDKKVQMVYDAQNSVTSAAVEAEKQTRFSISDEEAEALARLAVTIEKHYERPMDIEWAKDGKSGKLYILQARPETVQSRVTEIERYKLRKKSRVILEGRSVGHKIGVGTARIIDSPKNMDQVQVGDILVTDMTDPDWEPIMKRASAIMTNRGGRTCHSAIIARELGIPAVVGCGNATEVVIDGKEVTVSCAEGDTGFVYEGKLEYDIKRISVGEMPPLSVKIMMNVANPDLALSLAALPNEGVGLARLEFIINRMVGVHPKAVLEFETLSHDLKAKIMEKMAGYSDPVSFYRQKLAEGIATIAAAFYPKPVIVRLSDFKSNEYANLLGGDRYEPREENPMLGFRGASRYISRSFRDCFQLECEAIKHVRNSMGLENVWVMVPFVRTVDEAKRVVELLAKNGLKRGENGLKIIMMCEIPSNALLAEEFLEYFDGFSIGSNDLTQLTLGLDRDSALVAESFDERNEAVRVLLLMAISACKKHGKYIGICGQGPSDHPDLAKWLMDQGITSISLTPDTVIETWMMLGEK